MTQFSRVIHAGPDLVPNLAVKKEATAVLARTEKLQTYIKGNCSQFLFSSQQSHQLHPSINNNTTFNLQPSPSTKQPSFIMLFNKVVILAAAGLVASEAAPQVTQPAVLRRDLGDDLKNWAETKAGEKITDVEEWAKTNANEVQQWASEHGGDAKSWVKDNYSNAGDYVSTKADAAGDFISTKADAASTKIEAAISGASASASAAAKDDDNAAASLSGQSGVVAMMAAIGVTAFGFFLA